MTALQNKIDFAVVFEVKNANPNGDPLNGNRPRTDYDGIGEVTDVCLKRKIRDRLLEQGHSIFVQSEDRKSDDATSLRDRAEKNLGKKLTRDETIQQASEKWLDVRAFGQLFAFSSKKKEEGSDGVSIGIRGPVTVQSAFSIAPVEVVSVQITKSVNGEDPKKAGGRTSDTMGMKHRVKHGVYVFYGAMNPQLAEKTGFSDQDAEAILEVLPRIFENDASSARPEGTLQVLKAGYWKHTSKAGQYSSAKVHQTLKVRMDDLNPNGELELQVGQLDGLVFTELPLF
ncbi:MAG: type I-C CRISPR-associated protein Cas7/Csd2 [bacterium]|nr:type I-C CRISPR-associated protein Cas7/Csd2 [bacterium]